MQKKNTESKYPKVVKSKNGRIMLLSKCTVYDRKKPKFIKEQEAAGLETYLSKIPLVGTP